MEKKQTILIIEDEPNILHLMETVLSKNGYVTVGAGSAEAGLKRLPSVNPSLILIDIQLPEMDGLECCRVIRENPHTKNIPLILVSVQASDINKVIGLESGADDFIAKPFNPNELIARVKAVLRRAEHTQAPSKNRVADTLFELDLESHTAALNKKKLKLTPKEFTLLTAFVRSEGKVLTRDMMSAQIWERENLETSRTIDVHIGRLRKKLGKYAVLIQTVGKMGYRYNPSLAKEL